MEPSAYLRTRGGIIPHFGRMATAWCGIYQALLWYEPVATIPGRTGLPHIIDANRLTHPLSAKGELRIWQARAVAVEKYMVEQWEMDPSGIAEMVDKLMKLAAYTGLRRQNIVGSAFAGLVKHALELFGSQSVTYELEVAGDRAFPGVQLPTRTGGTVHRYSGPQRGSKSRNHLDKMVYTS